MKFEWFAGFWEGEGTVSIRRAGQGYGAQLTTGVVNVDKDLVDAYTAFGGSVRPCSKVEGWKQAYRWQANGPTALSFLEAIEPFVRSRRSHERIAVAREFQSQKGTRGRHQTEEDRAREAALRVQMMGLNARGEQMSIYECIADAEKSSNEA